MAAWNAFLEQARGVYKGMGARERAIVIGGTATMLAGLVYAVFFFRGGEAGEPVSAVSFSPTEQARALELLSEAGVSATVRQNVLYVPRALAGTARMVLASQDALPSQGFGFPQILSRQPFPGRREQDRDWLIALQSEIERSIQAIEGVESARVIINPGDETLSVIASEREFGKPTASVLLRLRRRDRLADEAAVGVQNLIAAAWRGMRPEDVRITDTAGRVYEPRRKSEMGEATSLLQLQGQIEHYYAAKVRRLFDSMPGVVAVVNARLKASAIERQVSQVNPDQVVDIFRKTTEERREHLGDRPGSPVGVDSNLGSELVGDPGTEKMVDTRAEEEVRSEVTRIVERIIEKPGELLQMTASVMIPRRVDPATLASGEVRFLPYTPEELTRFQKQVMGACGIAEARAVEVMDYDPPPERYAPATPLWRDMLEESLRRPERWLLGAAALLSIVFLYRIARASPGATAAGAASPGGGAPEEAAHVRELKMPELTAEEKMQEQIRQAVQKNPQLAAGLIRRWLTQDQERKG